MKKHLLPHPFQHGLVRNDSSGGVNGSSSSVSSVTDRGAELKTKRSELRLYCDMIMQQVHSIRSAADVTPGLNLAVRSVLRRTYYIIHA